MKNFKIFIIAAMASGLAACNNAGNTDTTATTEEVITEEINGEVTDTTSTVASVIYTCPMHPEVQQNEPGKCPKCNMDLEEKK